MCLFFSRYTRAHCYNIIKVDSENENLDLFISIIFIENFDFCFIKSLCVTDATLEFGVWEIHQISLARSGLC